MKLSIVLIAFILIILALVAYFVAIPFVTAHAFWFMTAGAVLLAFKHISK